MFHSQKKHEAEGLDGLDDTGFRRWHKPSSTEQRYECADKIRLSRICDIEAAVNDISNDYNCRSLQKLHFNTLSLNSLTSVKIRELW